MITSRRWPGVILLAVALVSCVSALQAATTILHVQLGESFAGSIGTAGVDTVNANFNAVQGTTVTIAAQAVEGFTLRPTISLMDGSGTPIDPGTAMEIEWLPTPNALYFFTVPVSGYYTAVIGGSSGNGEFTASITGTTPANVAMTTLSGSVTNSGTGAPIPNAAVFVGPYVLFTDASGAYSGQLPIGDYSVTVEAEDYITATTSVELTAGTAADLDIGMAPTIPVVVTASVSGTAVPGGVLTATVTVESLDGSAVEEISWTQEEGVEAAITGADTDTATVTLGSRGAYKQELLHVLSEPPIGPDQLPPNVPVPEEEFLGGLQNRFTVVAVNPFALEETGLVALEVEVTTSSGTYHDEVEVNTALPWRVAGGIKNVAVGAPVLLHGKDQGSYDWDLTPPGPSSATLMDGTSQNPEFTPDVPGLYQVTVFEEEAGRAMITMMIYAGTWRGVIVGQDNNGRPVADGACTACHSGLAPDKFTPWKETGHAEIFTNNLNTSTHYGSSCFPCHTVGYDPGIANGGADEAPDYQDFLDAGLLNHPGDNWTAVLEEFPETAQLANIQCENCHGPQEAGAGEDNGAHGWRAPSGEPRVDLSADVCGVCHGEPLRHARFQQWQLSAHANYELAIDEGTEESCSRCHTANGFLTWWPILIDDDPETDPTDEIEVSWTADEVHPQTCVTCHDPHNIGTVSGSDPTVTIRISGDTPPLIAGFTATDVGHGAMCMTCHNSRRGLRNDDTFGDFYGTSEAARAPHGSAQTDVLMGQNAYLVNIPQRGGHSFLPDTCVTCHMEKTPPPDLLAYNQGGTNHTFFASKEICSECHDGLTANIVQDAVQGFLDQLQSLIEEGILDLMAERIAMGNVIDLDEEAQITDVDDVAEIEFGESHGRQAISVTFTGGEMFGPYRMNDISVYAGPINIGDLYDFADPVLIKAGWNWNLFNNDGSRGAHNPFFAFDALITARDMLEAQAAPARRGDRDQNRQRRVDRDSPRGAAVNRSRPTR